MRLDSCCSAIALISVLMASAANAQTPQDRILGAASQLGQTSADTPQAKAISLPSGAAAWVQLFERGAVFLLPGNKAQVVAGAILKMWSNMGGQGGSLGLPAADEASCPDGSGNRFQLFEKGSIVFQPSTQRIGFSMNPSAPCQVLEFATVPMSTKTAALVGGAMAIADAIVDAMREAREKKEAARKAAGANAPPADPLPPQTAAASYAAAPLPPPVQQPVYQPPPPPPAPNFEPPASPYPAAPPPPSIPSPSLYPDPAASAPPPAVPSPYPPAAPASPYPAIPTPAPPSPYTPAPTPTAPPPATPLGSYTPIVAPQEQAPSAGPNKFYLAEPVTAKQLARAAEQLKKAFSRERDGADPMLVSAAAAAASLAGASEAQTRVLPIDWKRIKSALEPVGKDKSAAKVARAAQWTASNMGLSRQLRGSVRVDTAAMAQRLAGMWQWQQANGTTEANQGIIFVSPAKAAPRASLGGQARALEVPFPLAAVLSSGGNPAAVESSAASALDGADTDVAYIGAPIIVNRGYRRVRMAAMIIRTDEIGSASYSGFGLGQTSVSLRVLDGDRVVCADPRPSVRFLVAGPGGDKLSGQDQIALSCEFDRSTKDATVYSVIVVIEAGAGTVSFR